jgi:hypothetical protein
MDDDNKREIETLYADLKGFFMNNFSASKVDAEWAMFVVQLHALANELYAKTFLR